MVAKRFPTRIEEEIEQLLHDKSSKLTNEVLNKIFNEVFNEVLTFMGATLEYPDTVVNIILENDEYTE